MSRRLVPDWKIYQASITTAQTLSSHPVQVPVPNASDTNQIFNPAYHLPNRCHVSKNTPVGDFVNFICNINLVVIDPEVKDALKLRIID